MSVRVGPQRLPARPLLGIAHLAVVLDRRLVAPATSTTASGLAQFVVNLMAGGNPNALSQMASIPVRFATLRARPPVRRPTGR